MPSLGEIAEAAVQDAAFRLAWAARIIWKDTTELRITNCPDPLIIGGLSYVLNDTLDVPDAPTYGGQVALDGCSVSFIDVEDAVRAQQYAKTLKGSSVYLYRLFAALNSHEWESALFYPGVVESCQLDQQVEVTLSLGPDDKLWGALCPPVLGPTCYYRSTTQCEHALTCAKSWDACTENDKRDIFSGNRFIPVDGLMLEMRGSQSPVDSRGGGRIIIVV